MVQALWSWDFYLRMQRQRFYTSIYLLGTDVFNSIIILRQTMQDLGFRFANTYFCLAYPDELAEPVNLLFRDITRTKPTRNEKVLEILRENEKGSYRIVSESSQSGIIEGSEQLYIAS